MSKNNKLKDEVFKFFKLVDHSPLTGYCNIAFSTYLFVNCSKAFVKLHYPALAEHYQDFFEEGE